MIHVRAKYRVETDHGTVIVLDSREQAPGAIDGISNYEPFTFSTAAENNGAHEGRRIARNPMVATSINWSKDMLTWKIWCAIDIEHVPITKNRLNVDPFSQP